MAVTPEHINTASNYTVNGTDNQYFPYSEGEQKIIESAKEIISSKLIVTAPYNKTKVVKDFLVIQLGNRKREIFSMLFLNNNNQLIKYEEIFKGDLTSTSISARVCAQKALEFNASKVILAHCHPGSNEAEPSNLDLNTTDQLVSALNIFNIKVLDHIIISGSSVYSFVENSNL